jgi:hypothetical protein
MLQNLHRAYILAHFFLVLLLPLKTLKKSAQKLIGVGAENVGETEPYVCLSTETFFG